MTVTRARDAAAALRGRGFALCKPDPQEKKPTYCGWPTRSLEAEEFGDGDMIGVLGGPLSDGNRPGHALVIVDLDSPQAVEFADEFLPPTGMSEGRASKPRSHRYYLVPLDSIPEWAHSHAEQASAAAKEQKGHPGPFLKSFPHRDTGKEIIRLIGTGAQAVCPPSMHESGERREWAGGEPGEPAVVPFVELWQLVGELASACRAEVPDVMPRPQSPPRPRSPQGLADIERRALAYLGKTPGAVSGSGGHKATMWAARCLVYGFDLAPETAFTFLSEVFNPKCVPPWSEKELAHKVSDADRLPFDKPRGWLRDAERPRRRACAAWGTGKAASAAAGAADRAGCAESLQGPPGEAVECLDFPPPKEGESRTDPHRLARLFVDADRTDDGEPTIRQWRDEFHRWTGAAWAPAPDSDLDSGIAAHCRKVFEVDYEYAKAAHEKAKEQAKVDAEQGLKGEKPGAEPTISPVTSRLKSDVKLNLGGQVNVPDLGDDAPFWIGTAEGLPAASEVISAPNGLFTLADIAAGKSAFTAPSPCFFSFNALPFAVEADPPIPRVWHRCLKEWLNGDAASILGLQEWMGYCLSSETRAHKLAFLVGPKRSGKGTVIRTLTKLLGERNVASTTFTRLGERFGLQPLLGKLLAVIPDARLSGRADSQSVVERLLSISGEDQQSIDRKNRPLLNVYLKARFLLASNEVPALPDASGALASRFLIFSFPNSWLAKEDVHLDRKLDAELPGILQWAARGYVRLCCNNFQFTSNEAAEQHRQALEDLGSPIRAFVRERAIIGPKCLIPKADLIGAWRAWCEENHMRAIEDGVFGRNLAAAFPHIKQTQPRIDGRKVRHYVGIDLRPVSQWGEPDEPGTGWNTFQTSARVAREG